MVLRLVCGFLSSTPLAGMDSGLPISWYPVVEAAAEWHCIIKTTYACVESFFFQLSFIISCVEHFLSSISDSLVHRVTLNHVKQIMLNPIIRRSELRAKPISDHGLDSRAGRSFGSWPCLFSYPHEGVSLRFFPFSYLHNIFANFSSARPQWSPPLFGKVII